MPTTAEIAAAREEAGQIFDDLALQLMVKGARALSAEALSKLNEIGVRAALTKLGSESKAALAQVQGAPLSDDQAKLLLGKLQAALAADAPGEAEKAAPADTSSTTFFKEDPEILADFVMESSEHLAAIEEKILLLEKDPTLIDTVHSVFRAFHTIKGLAGFLGLKGVQAVAHEVETLLDHARNGRIVVTSEVVDFVLESSEYLKEEVAYVEARLNGQPTAPIRDNAELIRTLSTATANVAAGRPLLEPLSAKEPTASETAAPPATVVAAESPTPAMEAAPTTAAPVVKGKAKAAAKKTATTGKKAPTPPVITEPRPEQPGPQLVETPPENQDFFPPLEEPVAPVVIISAPAEKATPVPPPPPAPIAVVPSSAVAVAPAAPVAVPPAGQPAPAANAEAAKAGRTEQTSASIRVEVSKLDRLMDMVGELVIAQSILSNNPVLKTDARLTGELSQLARISGEVQRSAMSMRMMPIGPLFQKNAKMVRDLSRRNGKQVSLELSGETTELDKTIAEELSDPLLHMIRNALDHGIEEPAERIASGKTPVASLHIGAEHQAGQIVISISDDGRGLDPQRIRNKAIQNGLIDPAAQLSQDDIFKLIFAPGFSTAEKITDISGRGVGMDVVRQHVETLRGRIEIKSELGKGTTFYIFLPLTLAIIEGLIIVVGDHRYVVPVFSVREMFRPVEEMLFTVQGRDEMILIRGDLLPLVRLHQRLGITPRTTDICEGLLVVCEFAGKRFCLFVDDLLGRQEIVIKSLDRAFQDIKGVSGSAILGDGRIGLILDVGGIFHSSPAVKEAIAA